MHLGQQGDFVHLFGTAFAAVHTFWGFCGVSSRLRLGAAPWDKLEYVEPLTY